MIDCVTDMSISVVGHCYASAASIRQAIESGRAAEVIHFGGSFVVVVEHAGQTWIITSPYGELPYFYTVQRGQLFHGRTSGEVVTASQLAWRWNPRALCDLFALEHLTGCDSLHADVARTPAASVLHWDGQQLVRDVVGWSALHARYQPQGSPTRLVDIVLDEVSRDRDAPGALMASAGFDSRVILAAMLAAGQRPELIVMGRPGATDRTVTAAIGQRFGLQVREIDLESEDYLSCATDASLITSGSLPAAHWHAYICPKKSALSRDRPLYVGNNGEYVRTFYLNKGVLASAANCLSGRHTAGAFWSRKAKHLFAADDLDRLDVSNARAFGEFARSNATRYAEMYSGDLLTRLDSFYLHERVRHFSGSGIAIYADFAAPRLPMLAPAWVAEAELLPRSWKHGNRWHRFAIERLCPELLAFPEEGVSATMRRTARPFYWLPMRRGLPVVPVFDYAKLFADQRILARLAQSLPYLDDLISPSAFHRVCQRSDAAKARRAASIVLSLAEWRRALASHQP